MKKNRNSVIAVLSIVTLLVGALGAPEAYAAEVYAKMVFSAQRDGNYDIYSMNSDGTEQTKLTTAAAYDTSPRYSHDGSKIVFVSSRDGNSEIYIMNSDGSNQTRLTSNSATDSEPSFSYDDTKIAFSTNRDGNYEIYSMNSDGTGQTRLTNEATDDYNPSFSNTSTESIVFSSDRSGDSELYTMDSNGSNLLQVTNDGVFVNLHPQFSRDDSKIAYTSNLDGGNTEIYIMDSGGTNRIRLTNNSTGDSEPSFSPDGLMLSFTAQRDGNEEIYTMKTDGTSQTRRTNNDGIDYNSAFSPSWDYLLITTVTYTADGKPVFTVNEELSSEPYYLKSGQTLNIGSAGSTLLVDVPSGAYLKGTGSAGSVTIYAGGHISPGNSPGCLSTSSLTLSGIYDAELGGSAACTEYDQLNVTGSVNLSGGSLNLSLYNGYLSKQGTKYTIIQNDASDAITGAFTGLAEGATVTVGNARFSISYIGGDGNDVVLTALNTPTAPNTGFELVRNNPLAATVASIAAALSIGYLARRRMLRA